MMNEEILNFQVRVKEQIEELKNVGYNNSSILDELERKLEKIAKVRLDLFDTPELLEETFEMMSSMMMSLFSIMIEIQKGQSVLENKLDKIDKKINLIDNKSSNIASILEEEFVDSKVDKT